MSNLMLWEDSNAKMVFKENMILSPTLTIRARDTILILDIEGINRQWGLIQMSTILRGSSNQGDNNLINLNRVWAQHWMKL